MIRISLKYHETVDSGMEMRVFDPARKAPDWLDNIRPSQCAVFLKSRTASTSLRLDGQPCLSQAEVTCIVFDQIEAAQRFCEAKVQDLPDLRCEIYDAHGLVNPPLLVVLHPEFQRKEESGPLWSRRRKWIGAILVLLSVLLFWMAARESIPTDLGIFLGINCVLLGLRFLYWHVGLKHSERKRRDRLEAHRKLEEGDA